MNILFLSYDYPNKHRASFEFVKQLVDALADRGNHCYVISPYSVTHEKRFWVGLEKVIRKNGGSVVVSRPNYLSLSNLQIGKFRPSSFFYKNAINKALKKMKFKPDVSYGHFWSSGWALYNYSNNNNIPLFVATGESDIKQMFDVSLDRNLFYDYVAGVICVSSKNRDESISLKLTTQERCLLAPNSINNNVFKVLNKKICREKLNLPQDVFIVIFVGWFKNVKGPKRVAKALDEINSGEEVYSIFIGGEGPEIPECKNILFKGRLTHDQVPIYLNAADVFVLPTLNEGCCNSIVEAMACGLPIISSNLPFNWDILNNNNSIMIDPNSVEEIKKAIITLRDDKELRQRLSSGSLEMARNLTIDKRAEKIEKFIIDKMKAFNNSRNE